MSADFNPHSPDAMFARVLSRLDAQDELLHEIREGVQKTNGRVTALERERWYQRGIVATIAVLAGGAWEWMKARH